MTKSQQKSLFLRLAALRAELADCTTPAAVHCVKESIDDAVRQFKAGGCPVTVWDNVT